MQYYYIILLLTGYTVIANGISVNISENTTDNAGKYYGLSDR